MKHIYYISLTRVTDSPGFTAVFYLDAEVIHFVVAQSSRPFPSTQAQRGLRLLSFSFRLSFSRSPLLFFSHSSSRDTKLEPSNRGKRTGSDAQLRDERKHGRYRQGRRVTEYRPIELHSASDLPRIKRSPRIPPPRKSCTFLAEYKSGVKDKTRGAPGRAVSLNRLGECREFYYYLSRYPLSRTNDFSLLSRSSAVFVSPTRRFPNVRSQNV